MILHWRQVPPDLSSAVVAAGRERWGTILPRLSTDPSGETRAAVAEVLGKTVDWTLAPLLVELLHDDDREVGNQAERSLIGLSVRVLRADVGAEATTARFLADTPEPLADRDIDALCNAAAQGAATFAEHRRRAPVTAVLSLASRERLRGGGAGAAALREWIGAAEHPSHSVLRSSIRWSNTPVTRLRALEWLAHPHLAGACADRLSRAATPLDHETVLANAHLLARPARAMRLAGMRVVLARHSKLRHPPKSEVEATVPAAGVLRMLSERARRQLPMLVRAFAPGPAVMEAALSALRDDPSPIVRHAAARGWPRASVATWCGDANAAVAGLARQRQREQVVEGRWDVTTVAQRLIWRQQLADDRAGFLADIREGLGTGEALSVLAVVRALSLALDVGPTLITSAEAPAVTEDQRRKLATVAALLAHLPGATAAPVLERLTEHTDPRIRANAVESLARVARLAGPRAAMPAVIIESKADPHHRVRANALRALADGDTPGGGVAAMLSDARPMHRLAGVWLAGRALPRRGVDMHGEWPLVLAQVREMARFDADGPVRARAQGLLECLPRRGDGGWMAWKGRPAATRPIAA